MKLIFFLIFVFVVLYGEIAAADVNRTRLSKWRRYRSSTTEGPEESLTTDLGSASTLTGFGFDNPKSDRERKIEELLSPRTKCGLLKVNTTVPWIVVIEHHDPLRRDKRKTLSKGVLIGDQHVLTTVSSIHNSHPFWITNSVRLGDPATWITEKSQRGDSNYTRVGIEQVYQHSTKDIAIIKLANKVTFTDYIQPVCLPIDDNYNFREMHYHMCKRVEDTDNNRKFDVRLLSSIPLAPQDCEILFHRKGAEFGASEFCAWDEFGDTCMSDVGGPLMAFFNGKYIVIGLNSYIFTSEEFESGDYPGVYVKVGSFLTWINTILSL